MAKVRILSESNGEAVDECSGPTWAGGCPNVEPGQRVACAGLRIELLNTHGVRLGLTVEPGATSCPLAPLNFIGHVFAKPRPRPGIAPAE
jgi:hypothetical protein